VNSQTQNLLVTLLVLFVALLQFLLHRGPQSDQVKGLEERLAEAEQRLEEILSRLET
jgi:hypothetical protein